MPKRNLVAFVSQNGVLIDIFITLLKIDLNRYQLNSIISEGNNNGRLVYFDRFL